MLCSKHRYTLLLLFPITLSFFVTSCTDKGTNPPELPEFQILEVQVNPNPAAAGDTVRFTAFTDDSVQTPYHFRWQLEQADGTTQDTLTQTNVLEWPAPQQAREYAHQVQVETEAGEVLSAVYSFWNTVVESTDPFYEQAELLFTVNTEGTYLMNTATGETRYMVHGGGPRWGPDGNRFAYVARSEGWNVFNVYIMNVEGAEKRAVSLMEHNGELEPHLGTSAYPAWSPNGKRMAYARCDNCEVGGNNYEVYNVAIDTSSGLDEIRVTDNLYSDYVHDWHPNGETLLIESDERLDGSYNAYGDIFEINHDGSGKSLFDSTGIARPRISPAGTQVAFTLNGAIYVADSNGSNRKQVIGGDNTTCTVTWAGSEEKLVFIMSETNCGADKKHIYTINTDGSGLRQLTNELGEYDDVDWRPINN